MKLIGKNSLARVVTTFSLIIFIIILYNTIYSIFGFTVCYYNYKTGNHFLENKFMIGQTVGYNLPLKDFIKPQDIGKIRYRHNNLFSDGLADTGLFNLATFLNRLSQGIFFSTFFFLIFKIFQSFTKEKLFTPLIIKYLKYFAYLNILYGPIVYIEKVLTNEAGSNVAISVLAQIIMGTVILFAVAIFKKGHELQSENDLTI